MDAQTLQQQTPIYHVCQECNGAGCAACSDLLILDGDIQLDPDYVSEHTVEEQLEWLDAFSERVQLLTKMAPINGVIGTTPDDYSSIESRLAHVNKLAARMPYRVQNAGINRDVLCDSAPKFASRSSRFGEFVVFWKNVGHAKYEFDNEHDALAYLDYVLTTFGSNEHNYLQYPDGRQIFALPLAQPEPVCCKCGKSNFDTAYGCLSPNVLSPAAGDWVCCKAGSVKGLKLSLSGAGK